MFASMGASASRAISFRPLHGNPPAGVAPCRDLDGWYVLITRGALTLRGMVSDVAFAAWTGTVMVGYAIVVIESERMVGPPFSLYPLFAALAVVVVLDRYLYRSSWSPETTGVVTLSAAQLLAWNAVAIAVYWADFTAQAGSTVFPRIDPELYLLMAFGAAVYLAGRVADRIQRPSNADDTVRAKAPAR